MTDTSHGTYNSMGSQSTRVILVGSVFLAMSAVVIIWFSIGDWNRKRITDYAREDLKIIKETLGGDQLYSVQTTLEKMLAFPKVMAALHGKKNQLETETLLNGIAAGINAKLVYIMNDQGTVASCNRYGNSRTLIGNNYQFRKYFTRALIGKKVVYGAVGVTTGERGLYFSSPIVSPDHSEPLGVGVIKIGIENIEKTLASQDHPLALVSPSGVVFVSNREELLYKTIDILDEEQIAILHKSRQFADKTIETLPELIECDGNFYDRRNRIEVRKDLGIPGWQLVIWQGIEFPVRAAIALSFLVATLIISGGILVVARLDRVRGLQKIKKANDDLQLEIDERKKTEKELIVARKHSEVANAAKSEFLANMSHEIRTPINAVIGLAHLLLQTDMTPQQYDYLHKITLSADNLLTIINDILDFSKIEAGKLELETIPFELRKDILHNVSQVVGLIAAEKGLEILFDMEPDLPDRLLGDPVRLRQILINLINNAVKFTKKGEIILFVRMLGLSKEDIVIRFEVRDTGIGMTKEQLNGLFQAFSQADASTTRRFGGTGLGLTISKTLAEMMGGQIGAHSVYGEGSTFWFTARFRLGSQTDGQEKPPLSDDVKNLKVLVVDDNHTARIILTRYLKHIGHRVVDVSCGEMCIHLLQTAKPEETFDLVLLDWMMPGMDGLETARCIQSGKGLEKIPEIIMLTAYDKHKMVNLAKDMDLKEILVKPILSSSLLNAILATFSKAVPQREKYDTDKLSDHVLGARILLVEDNVINQQVAQGILENSGVTVSIAENGVKGIERLRAGDRNGDPFDVILMDIQMPVMDGYTATREIRKLSEFQKLPILAMTANALVGDRQEAIEAGMNDYVTKPINIKEFFRVLGEWIYVPEERRSKALQNTNDPSTDGQGDLAPVIIPTIAGINKVDGLQRMAGNRSLYKNLLKQFLSNYSTVTVEIKQALSDKDHRLAARLAHTIKGVAGNIGAVAIHQLSATLEDAIKEERHDDIGSALPPFEDELQWLLEGLHKAYPTTFDNKNFGSNWKPSIESEILRPILEQLRDYLADDDSEATDFFLKKKDLFSKAISPTILAALENKVQNFEFEEALDDLAVITTSQEAG